MSRLSERKREIISVFNISSAEAAEETWARAPRASHYIKSCRPSTASQPAKPPHPNPPKKPLSLYQSIMDLSECIHIGWQFSSSCHIPRERRKKIRQYQSGKKVATISLKSTRKKTKKKKITKNKADINTAEGERGGFFCVFISNFNYFQIKKSMSRFLLELDFFFSKYLPFFFLPSLPPPCRSDNDAGDTDKSSCSCNMPVGMRSVSP